MKTILALFILSAFLGLGPPAAASPCVSSCNEVQIVNLDEAFPIYWERISEERSWVLNISGETSVVHGWYYFYPKPLKIPAGIDTVIVPSGIEIRRGKIFSQTNHRELTTPVTILSVREDWLVRTQLTGTWTGPGGDLFLYFKQIAVGKLVEALAYRDESDLPVPSHLVPFNEKFVGGQVIHLYFEKISTTVTDIGTLEKSELRRVAVKNGDEEIILDGKMGVWVYNPLMNQWEMKHLFAVPNPQIFLGKMLCNYQGIVPTVYLWEGESCE